MKKQTKTELCVRGIRLVWESLETHLDSCIENSANERKYAGDEKFHKQTVADYVELLNIFTNLMNK